MILLKDAIKNNKIFEKNGLTERFRIAELANKKAKIVEDVINSNTQSKLSNYTDEKEEFIRNFPTTKTFTTQKGQTFTRKLYSFEIDYPKPELKERIFNHGKTGYTIWFLNTKKLVCVIDKATYKDDNIFVDIMIDVKGLRKKTSMTLDRFLHLVEKGDFTITLKKFVDTYLKDATESDYYKNKLNQFDDKIKAAAL